MNIFAFDPDPWTSALWLDDIRKNKMILETAQLLSSAMSILYPEHGMPVYRITHLGHPCTRWSYASRGNFNWLVWYLEALGKQRGKPHKSLTLLPYFQSYAKDGYFTTNSGTPFVNCARNNSRGLDFTSVSDTHLAYRLYINGRWKETSIPLSWNYGLKPEWKE